MENNTKTKDVEPDNLNSANTAYPFEIEPDKKNKAAGKRKKRKPVNDAPLP